MASFDSAAEAPARPPELRTAIASIAGFWAFYYVIVTLRAAIMGFEGQGDMLARRLVVAVVGMGLTFGLYWSLRPFARRNLPQRIAAAAVLALPFATLFGAFNYAAFYVYEPMERTVIQVTTSGDRVAQVAGKESMTPVAMIADSAVIWYFFFAAWAALHLALGYAADVGAAERRAAGFRAAARDAEIRALRYQVNPHFLFNTLNSLSTLILRNRPEEAERMILNLSTFFRTSLTADAARDLTLDEELSLQRLYLDIEAVRFPERLRVDVDVPRTLADACVPGLLLQPLVENAIKHGVSSTSSPVTLSIRADEPAPGRLEIVVANSGPDAATNLSDALFERPRAGTGTGLRNVRDRLAARFGEEAAMRWGPRAGGGYEVVLTLPLARHGC